MKYDGDGRATARFFSDKGCRRAPLFTAPADAARQERCLWSVSRVRRARDGRFTAPGIPAKGRRDVRRNAVSRTRSSSLRRVPAHCLPGATHPYESLSPGA
ncbi:hypothetical protein ACN94Q_005086, partial [Escherichia coli]